MCGSINDSVAVEKARCTICPVHCMLLPGESGRCGCRWNSGGMVMPGQYGRLLSLVPGTGADFSFSAFHSNGRFAAVALPGIEVTGSTAAELAPDISDDDFISAGGMIMEPGKLSDHVCALENGCLDGIVFTGSEPFLSPEYIIDTAHMLHRENRIAAAVSGGFVNERIARSLASCLDACVIRLPVSSPEENERRRNVFAVVRQTISLLYEKNVHIEVSLNLNAAALQSPEFVSDIFRWLSYIDRDIPVLLTCTAEKTVLPPLDFITESARQLLSAVSVRIQPEAQVE